MTDRVSNVRAVFSANTSQLELALGSVRRQLNQLTGAINSITSIVGVGFSAAAIVQFTNEAITAGNALERIQATLRAVTGSQAEYNRVLSVAQANQQLFGGSLEENLTAMQQFAFLANRSGASIEELTRVSQLLATVNPAEGFVGAGFAISELFSGDITSIVERFNLPRSAVRALADEGVSAQDKLKGLTDLLAQQGITSDTLAASLDTTAQTYLQLGNDASNALSSVGQRAAEMFEGTAKFLSQVLVGVNEIATLGERTFVSATDAATNAKSIEEYRAAIDKLTNSSNTYEMAQYRLNEAQFVYFKALTTAGVATEEAMKRAQQYGFELQLLDDGTYMTVESSSALADAQALLANNLQTTSMINRYAGNVAEETASLLDTQTIATKAVEDASKKATQAIYEVASAGGSMTDQAEAAANVLVYMGSAGEEMARKLAASLNPLDQLIARLYDINLNIAQARQDFAGLPAAGVPVRPIVTTPAGIVSGGGSRRGSSPRVSAAQREADQLAKIAQDYQDASIRAEERYQERLLRITEDYSERRRKAALEFSDQQFEDRVDFYRALSGIEDQAIRQQASAEYEALALEATAIRDAQGADVAATFLAQAAQISAARARRADEIAKARKDGSDNLEYLVALDKMEREVEDRRLQRARTGDGSLASNEQKDREDAQLKRQQDLEQASKDAGKALIDAQASATTAVTTTNDALTKQLELLQRIGAPVGPAPGTTTSTATTDVAPVAAAAPLGGGSTGTGFAVYDAAVVSALSQVRDAVNAVERAVGRVASARPLVSAGG